MPESRVKNPCPLLCRQFVKQNPTVQGIIEVTRVLRWQVPLQGSTKHVEVVPETAPNPAIRVNARHVETMSVSLVTRKARNLLIYMRNWPGSCVKACGQYGCSCDGVNPGGAGGLRKRATPGKRRG